MKQKLTDIAAWIQANGQQMDGIIVQGASIDSRTVKEGDLFIPFRGEQVNGHKYVKQAIEKGAVASLWMIDEPNPPEQLPLIFVDDPEFALQEIARTYRGLLDCKVIGITGSNGKTSTKDLIASVLSPYYNVRKTVGNYNNELGLPLTILSLDEDTEFAVLEMGMSNFGEISFLSKLARPHYVVITNIGEAHLQDLGSREGIAKAKFEIVDGLIPGGKLFYDGDEVLLKDFVSQTTGIDLFSFGKDDQNALSYQSVQSVENGSLFTTVGILEDEFMIPVYGSHQVKNTLAAILLADQIGLSVEDIQKALSKATLTDMRMQPLLSESGVLFINDAYNSAPTSLSAALDFMNETELRSKKWVILGDMLELGENEQKYHESFAGKLIAMNLEGVLLYGPLMESLYNELQKRDAKMKLVWSSDDFEPITDVIHKFTDEKSIVLLKGSRGLELENMLGIMMGNVDNI
ncbi:UDP-N-acetylmuramoyl-tripeptide--D-alanyl-D-alanine ligase [Sporosarcina siberiensis]|uniref:UDP-N-acetylmuramoyl-tripeptide--D-alanyl-D-alanine ligase n=1 Tax=Sporosarcina siberiensis TaxID=1365606 RepID=A0ABW4SGE8_9BACL